MPARGAKKRDTKSKPSVSRPCRDDDAAGLYLPETPGVWGEAPHCRFRVDLDKVIEAVASDGRSARSRGRRQARAEKVQGRPAQPGSPSRSSRRPGSPTSGRSGYGRRRVRPERDDPPPTARGRSPGSRGRKGRPRPPALNHRRSKAASSRRTRKAVSDRFISRATRCIHDASAGPGSRHTAAGLPLKGSPVNASTCVIVSDTSASSYSRIVTARLGLGHAVADYRFFALRLLDPILRERG